MRYRVVEFWNGYDYRFRAEYEAGPDAWVHFGPNTFSRQSEAEEYIVWENSRRCRMRVVAMIGEQEKEPQR